MEIETESRTKVWEDKIIDEVKGK
jgi:hypothetical protein